MDEYEINDDTFAILPINEKTSKIIEKDRIFIVNLPVKKIIEKSCEYFGSSYQGRSQGTKNLIGVSHKAPIIIEESREIIFFPTTSPRLYECTWVSLKNLQNYKKNEFTSTVIFNNGHLLNLDISYG